MCGGWVVCGIEGRFGWWIVLGDRFGKLGIMCGFFLVLYCWEISDC